MAFLLLLGTVGTGMAATTLPQRGASGSALIHATIFGTIEEVRQAVKDVWWSDPKEGARLDQSDSRGATALHWAAALRQVEIGTYLLEKGANPNAKDMFGMTPLHFFLVGQRLCYNDSQMHEMASRPGTWDWLIAKGANPDLADDSGMTPNQFVKRIEAEITRIHEEERRRDMPFHWTPEEWARWCVVLYLVFAFAAHWLYTSIRGGEFPED